MRRYMDVTAGLSSGAGRVAKKAAPERTWMYLQRVWNDIIHAAILNCPAFSNSNSESATNHQIQASAGGTIANDA